MVSKQQNLPGNIPAFFDRFRRESDRAAGVLGAALLDVQLQRVFRARLTSETPDRVFEFRGPLGDFASRIDLAFGLGWIDSMTHADLHVVRGIRNDFAHQADHELTFDEQSITDRTKNFHSAQIMIQYVRELESVLPESDGKANAIAATRANFNRPRSRYTGAVGLLAEILASLEGASKPMPLDSISLEAHLRELMDESTAAIRAIADEVRGKLGGGDSVDGV
jgi:DNA-binding MltR family transcriptional regulator